MPQYHLVIDTNALRLLGRDSDLAWQCYAMSLLAEHLADEE